MPSAKVGDFLCIIRVTGAFFYLMRGNGCRGFSIRGLKAVSQTIYNEGVHGKSPIKNFLIRR